MNIGFLKEEQKWRRQFIAVVSVNDFKADPLNFHQCLHGLGRKLKNVLPSPILDRITLGTLYIQSKNSKEKVCVYLFTCVTVRAIYLELINDITAEQFQLALTRFITRRGKPTQIILDNAPQLELTKTAIDKAWKETISNHEVQSYNANHGIEWNWPLGWVDFMRLQSSAKRDGTAHIMVLISRIWDTTHPMFFEPPPPCNVVKKDLLHFSGYNYESATLHRGRRDNNRTKALFSWFYCSICKFWRKISHV